MSAVDNLRLSIAGNASHDDIRQYWDAAVSLTKEADRDVKALEEMRSQRLPVASASGPEMAHASVSADILCFRSNSR